jgi:hypothetical protein
MLNEVWRATGPPAVMQPFRLLRLLRSQEESSAPPWRKLRSHVVTAIEGALSHPSLAGAGLYDLTILQVHHPCTDIGDDSGHICRNLWSASLLFPRRSRQEGSRTCTLASPSKPIAGPMELQVSSVFVAETGERRRGSDAKRLSRPFTELGTRQDRAVVGKADEAAVERGVPKGGEEEPVVHVEALRVGAIRPGHDVGSTQQSWFGDTGHRAATIPVNHQGIAEHVLADALYHHPFCFGRAGKIARLGLKAIEWRFRQAHRQLVDAVERGVQLCKVGDYKGRDSWAWRGRNGQWTDLRDDAGMVERDEPWAAAGGAGDPD